MRDLEFYNAGIQELRGVRRIVVPFRRLLRRLLRPVYFREVEILRELDHRLNRLEVLTQRHEQVMGQVQAVMAWRADHLAVTRRLAMLEDRMEALLNQHPLAASPTDEARPLRPFRGSESQESKARAG